MATPILHATNCTWHSCAELRTVPLGAAAKSLADPPARQSHAGASAGCSPLRNLSRPCATRDSLMSRARYTWLQPPGFRFERQAGAPCPLTRMTFATTTPNHRRARPGPTAPLPAHRRCRPANSGSGYRSFGPRATPHTAGGSTPCRCRHCRRRLPLPLKS